MYLAMLHAEYLCRHFDNVNLEPSKLCRRINHHFIPGRTVQTTDLAFLVLCVQTITTIITTRTVKIITSITGTIVAAITSRLVLVWDTAVVRSQSDLWDTPSTYKMTRQYSSMLAYSVIMAFGNLTAFIFHSILNGYSDSVINQLNVVVVSTQLG